MIIFQLLQFNTQFILNTHVTVQHVQKVCLFVMILQVKMQVRNSLYIEFCCILHTVFEDKHESWNLDTVDIFRWAGWVKELQSKFYLNALFIWTVIYTVLYKNIIIKQHTENEMCFINTGLSITVTEVHCCHLSNPICWRNSNS